MFDQLHDPGMAWSGEAQKHCDFPSQILAMQAIRAMRDFDRNRVSIAGIERAIHDPATATPHLCFQLVRTDPTSVGRGWTCRRCICFHPEQFPFLDLATRIVLAQCQGRMIDPIDLRGYSQTPRTGHVGQLLDRQAGRSFYLEPEHVIGRSLTSALVIDDPLVSSHHAVLRWTGEHWELRDLGSRNGSWIDGVRVAGLPQAVQLGAHLSFGNTTTTWELVDNDPPTPLLHPIGGGGPVSITGELIALPSADDPDVTVLRDATGQWRVETTHTNRVLNHGDLIEIRGVSFRFSSPVSISATRASDPGTQPPAAALLFAVSRDEEYVELRANLGGQLIELGASARNYLLLTLARKRLADRQQYLPETSCGWMYQDQLLQALRISQSQLNIDVFRLRKNLADKSIPLAANVVERRGRGGQLRLGFSQFTIRVL